MPISILPYIKALSPINDLCRLRIPCFAAQRVRFATRSKRPKTNLMERILITCELFYHRLCKPFSVIKSEDSNIRLATTSRSSCLMISALISSRPNTWNAFPDHRFTGPQSTAVPLANPLLCDVLASHQQIQVFIHSFCRSSSVLIECRSRLIHQCETSLAGVFRSSRD